MDEWLNGYFGQEKLSKQYLRKIFPLYVARERIKGRESEVAETGRNIFPGQISPEF